MTTRYPEWEYASFKSQLSWTYTKNHHSTKRSSSLPPLLNYTKYEVIHVYITCIEPKTMLGSLHQGADTKIIPTRTTNKRRERGIWKKLWKGYDFQGLVPVLVHIILVAPIYGAHHVVRHTVFLLFGGFVRGHVQSFVHLQTDTRLYRLSIDWC